MGENPDATKLMFTFNFVHGALTDSETFGTVGTDFKVIETDSRKAAEGVLFVALPGDKFDGHDFILDTLAKGATGVVCRADWKQLEEARNKFTEAVFFTVKDTVKAYRQLGAAWRKHFHFPVIAVAGSVGKTTTKEMLAAILTGKFTNVLKTTGSQNGFVGIPMTLLSLRDSHNAAVIEVGIDEPSTMMGHMDVVSPNAAVLTAIGPEHLEKLIDVPTVAREEGATMEWISKHGGTAVIRVDDEWISPLATKFKYKKRVTFGFNAASDCKAHFEHDKLVVSFATGMQETFDLALPGEHNASNQLAAIAVAYALGMSAAEIRAGLKNFQTAKGRTEIKKIGPGATFICDYYNANPSSMDAALKLLAAEPVKSGKKIACLGDMLELGPNELKFHAELKPAIEKSGASMVLLYGPRMKSLFGEMSSSKVKAHHFATHEELGKFLASNLSASDVVLVKGSRGMRMEEILKCF